MELNRLTRDADDLIRKVVSRYNQLYIPAGSISQLELDLMLDDLRKLYDTFKTIGQVHLTLRSEAARPEVSVDKQIPEEPAYQAESVIAANEESVQSPEATTLIRHPEPEPAKETEPEAFPEPASEFIPSVPENGETPPVPIQAQDPAFESPADAEAAIPEHEKSFSEINKNPVHSTDTETFGTTLADRFSSGSRSLSETMATSQSQGVGSRILFHPIADLTTGIGLNDKFSFISELFANNPAVYDEAIARINKAVNMDEAGWILQKYHHSDWEHKHEILARLKDFIKRRFI